MSMDDMKWPLRKVLNDWRQYGFTSRDKPPPDHSVLIFRHIRSTACRNAAPNEIECAKWSQIDPIPASERAKDFIAERKGPFLNTAEYVCGDKCKHPPVTAEMFILKLGLAETKQNFSTRTLQRYLNDKKPMPTDQFRRVIANALAQGWLGEWQAVNAFKQVNEMQIAQKGIFAVVRRAMERKSFLLRKELDIDAQELEREFEKQHRLLDHETIKLLDQQLKREDLTVEVRQMLEEALLNVREKK